MINRIKELLANRAFREAISLIDSTLEADDHSEGELLVLKTRAMVALGEYDSTPIDRALKLLKEHGDTAIYALAKYLKARTLTVQGELREALEVFTESYVYFKRVDDSLWMGRASNEQSYIAYQQADYPRFFDFAERSLLHFAAGGDKVQLGMIRTNIALARLRCGYLSMCKSDIAELQSNFLSVLPDDRRYNVHHVGALLFAQLGDFATSHRHLHLASQLSHELRRELFRQREISGYVHTLESSFGMALEDLKSAEQMAIQVGGRSTLMSQTKRLLADLYVALRRYKDAQSSSDAALAIAERLIERLEIAACWRVFAQVAVHDHKPQEAKDWFTKAIDLFNMIGARYELAVTQYLAAVSDVYAGGERAALLHLAKDYFEREEVRPYLDKVAQALAQVKPTVRPAKSGAARTVLIAADKEMKKLIELAEHVAQSEMSVLLTGATGTGKDMLARFIHECSGRSGKFVTVNAAAIPSALFESELFGFRKGAYTGATADKPGLLEEAEGGTFYLNEIGDATPEAQAKLLEVLESKRIRRIGDVKERPVNFRLISATNVDLRRRVSENRFRADLFHRINMIQIGLPSLSERLDDIEPLVAHFLAGLGATGLTNGGETQVKRLAAVLGRQPWPGNVRELRGALEQFWMRSGHDFEKMIVMAEERRETATAEAIDEAMVMTGGNVSGAARRLGVSEGTLRYRRKGDKL